MVISRSDIAAVLAYRRGASLLETRVVLVREFRSNAATRDGFVHELPGGSSPDAGQDSRAVAAAELHEETGVQVRSLAEILAAEDIDWTHVGMMLSVVAS